MSNAAAIIVAAGRGERAGAATPKQWQFLLGRQVINWSIDAFLSHAQVTETVVVTGKDVPDTWTPSGVRQVTGGDTRTASVLAGLSALNGSDDRPVLIHDAARPGLDQHMIDRLLAALDSADAAAPALPMADALKLSHEGRLKTVNRDQLYRVQTPQAFRLGTIRRALEQADASFVDDLEAVEALGAAVELVPGANTLHKITYPEDFDLMQKILSSHAPFPRIGKGFDVHAFEAGDRVTLCGVSIPHSAGLKGHSDADVGWHALTDAILGAAALGDIGDHFPPSDPEWANADSAIFLKHAYDLVAAAGWQIVNCDITLICEAPKIKPSREAMRERTAEVLDLPVATISVKATTTEALGFTGRREGIAAEAVVMLAPRSDV